MSNYEDVSSDEGSGVAPSAPHRPVGRQAGKLLSALHFDPSRWSETSPEGSEVEDEVEDEVTRKRKREQEEREEREEEERRRRKRKKKTQEEEGRFDRLVLHMKRELYPLAVKLRTAGETPLFDSIESFTDAIESSLRKGLEGLAIVAKKS